MSLGSALLAEDLDKHLPINGLQEESLAIRIPP